VDNFNVRDGKTAVLLLAHGTPNALDEIPAYLSNVTGGRPIPDAAAAEIRHRYSLIAPRDGPGLSPLTALTLEQGRLLEERLGLPVYIGMRNWSPYVADVVHEMIANGVTEAVSICLAPQNSRTSVGLYRRAVMAAAGDKLAVEFVAGWADHPLLADAFAEKLRAVRELSPAEPGQVVPVVFTAHSVPCRTVQTQPGQLPDPYSIEAKATAALVAERVGLLEKDWFFAFQSQGISGGPWIGPTVEDTLIALRDQGTRTVILQPIGFLCDHVEVLYDVDIGFQKTAAGLGLHLARPESLNASPLLTSALADLAQQGLQRLLPSRADHSSVIPATQPIAVAR
jgi:protoporphyrin/coproporphyrin ferrochelatase